MISRWNLRSLAALAVLTVALGGCKSAQDKAIEDAKAKAVSTGQPQQIVSTDSSGNTVTTTVQPPVAGQNGQVVTTTVTPPAGSSAPPTTTSATTPTAAPAAAPATTPAPAPVAANQPAPAPVPAPAPQPPPSINVPAGTALAIRIDHRISAKDSQPGEKFTGEVVEPVAGSTGGTAIPKGARVTGVIDSAKGRGHFKGAAEIQLRLTSLSLNGTRYPLETHDIERSKKGKGKRTAALVGGGSGLGLLIGGLAGGGKGALIGGLAGAGAGTAGAGLTGNKDLVIPAETVVRFKLADDLVIQP